MIVLPRLSWLLLTMEEAEEPEEDWTSLLVIVTMALLWLEREVVFEQYVWAWDQFDWAGDLDLLEKHDVLE